MAEVKYSIKEIENESVKDFMKKMQKYLPIYLHFYIKI